MAGLLDVSIDYNDKIHNASIDDSIPPSLSELNAVVRRACRMSAQELEEQCLFYQHDRKSVVTLDNDEVVLSAWHNSLAKGRFKIICASKDSSQAILRRNQRRPRRRSRHRSRQSSTQKKFSYQISDTILGVDSNAQLKLCIHVETGQLLTMKEYVLEGDIEEHNAATKTIQDQIYLMRKHQHENVLKYLGMRRQGNVVRLFMEYANEKNARETIRRFETVTEGAVRSYVQQVLRALEHMHTQGIAHGAVRLDNIFIDTTGLVKISGFSASRRIRSVRRGKRLSSESRQAMEFKRDVWSLGHCTLELLLNGEHVDCSCPEDLPAGERAVSHAVVKSVLQRLQSSVSSDCMQFLQRCLDPDPHTRSSTLSLNLLPFIAHSSPMRGGVTPPGDDSKGASVKESHLGNTPLLLIESKGPGPSFVTSENRNETARSEGAHRLDGSMGIGAVHVSDDSLGWTTDITQEAIASLKSQRQLLLSNTTGSVGTALESSANILLMSNGWDLYDPLLERNARVGDAEAEKAERQKQAAIRDKRGLTPAQQAFLKQWETGEGSGEEEAGNSDESDVERPQRSSASVRTSGSSVCTPTLQVSIDRRAASVGHTGRAKMLSPVAELDTNRTDSNSCNDSIVVPLMRHADTEPTAAKSAWGTTSSVQMTGASNSSTVNSTAVQTTSAELSVPSLAPKLKSSAATAVDAFGASVHSVSGVGLEFVDSVPASARFTSPVKLSNSAAAAARGTASAPRSGETMLLSGRASRTKLVASPLVPAARSAFHEAYSSSSESEADSHAPTRRTTTSYESDSVDDRGGNVSARSKLRFDASHSLQHTPVVTSRRSQRSTPRLDAAVASKLTGRSNSACDPLGFDDISVFDEPVRPVSSICRYPVDQMIGVIAQWWLARARYSLFVWRKFKYDYYGYGYNFNNEVGLGYWNDSSTALRGKKLRVMAPRELYTHLASAQHSRGPPQKQQKVSPISPKQTAADVRYMLKASKAATQEEDEFTSDEVATRVRNETMRQELGSPGMSVHVTDKVPKLQLRRGQSERGITACGSPEHSSRSSSGSTACDSETEELHAFEPPESRDDIDDGLQLMERFEITTPRTVMPVYFARVVADYSAEDEGEITVSVSEIVRIVTEDESGWWDVEVVSAAAADEATETRRGWMPCTYLEWLTEDEAAEYRAKEEKAVHSTANDGPSATGLWKYDNELQEWIFVDDNGEPLRALTPEAEQPTDWMSHLSDTAKLAALSSEGYKLASVHSEYEAEDEGELTLNVTDIIEVLEEDPSGWWFGRNRSSNDTGWFPASFVQWCDDNGDAVTAVDGSESVCSSVDEQAPCDATQPSVSIKQAIAVWPYNATAENELSLAEGASVEVSAYDDNGWCYGELERDGAVHCGWFPMAFVSFQSSND